MARYTFVIDGSVTPYALFGPTIGFLTGAKVDFNGDVYKIKDETAGVDFGIVFGGGASMEMEQVNPFVEIRYGLGFTNVNTEANESTVKNRGLLIVIGATVPLDRITD